MDVNPINSNVSGSSIQHQVVRSIRRLFADKCKEIEEKKQVRRHRVNRYIDEEAQGPSEDEEDEDEEEVSLTQEYDPDDHEERLEFNSRYLSPGVDVEGLEQAQSTEVWEQVEGKLDQQVEFVPGRYTGLPNSLEILQDTCHWIRGSASIKVDNPPGHVQEKIVKIPKVQPHFCHLKSYRQSAKRMLGVWARIQGELEVKSIYLLPGFCVTNSVIAPEEWHCSTDALRSAGGSDFGPLCIGDGGGEYVEEGRWAETCAERERRIRRYGGSSASEDEREELDNRRLEDN